MVEILILNLKPGTRNKFHEVYVNESLPIQKKWNIHVVAHGPSLHDETSYYVIRSFKSLEDRQQLEDAFYNSDDWRNGPRETILGMIENSAYAVIDPGQLKEWA